MSEEPIYRSRPGADALAPATAERAQEVAPGIWCSPGLSNAYLLTTADGRVVVNTGMGFESQVHRANFDAVDSSPIRYIIVTQGHYDHVGGLDTMRDPATQVIAQANWRQWRDDNDRLAATGKQQRFRVLEKLVSGIAAIAADSATDCLRRQVMPPTSRSTTHSR
jgi:glyoxylase-like metal-dependent hydrolase (beta-lactamase superfamily II)